MLTYKRSNDLICIGYLESDFAGCPDDKKSTFGYVFMIGGGVVSWKSVKQSLTATFTMEAEYVTCYEATWEAVWLKNFISRFNIVESILKPLTIYCDNIAAVSFSQNNKISAHTKHFDIKYQFVREKICEHLTRIKHVSTDCMLVDPLTKGLTIEMFKRHVNRIGLVEFFNVLG